MLGIAPSTIEVPVASPKSKSRVHELTVEATPAQKGLLMSARTPRTPHPDEANEEVGSYEESQINEDDITLLIETPAKVIALRP